MFYFIPFIYHLLSKVSNGVLLDEYQHNLDAAMNIPNLAKKLEEVENNDFEWIETKMHLRRRSSL